MKTKLLFFVLFFATCTLFVHCGSRQGESADTKAEEGKDWEEMDEFHMVMAETFHPYKDSADLQPVKAKAGELAAAADKWASSALPKKVDNDEMKTSLQELKSEAEILEDLVQTGTNEAIGEQLTKVHDKFHHIQEAWYGGEGHEHH